MVKHPREISRVYRYYIYIDKYIKVCYTVITKQFKGGITMKKINSYLQRSICRNIPLLLRRLGVSG